MIPLGDLRVLDALREWRSNKRPVALTAVIDGRSVLDMTNNQHLGGEHKVKTMNEIKRANAAAGEHWFSPDTLRFFRSRVGSKTWPHPEHDGAYFISSEQQEHDTPRCYTIREARPDGSIETVGKFMGFPSRVAAEVALVQLLRGPA